MDHTASFTNFIRVRMRFMCFGFGMLQEEFPRSVRSHLLINSLPNGCFSAPRDDTARASSGSGAWRKLLSIPPPARRPVHPSTCRRDAGYQEVGKLRSALLRVPAIAAERSGGMRGRPCASRSPPPRTEFRPARRRKPTRANRLLPRVFPTDGVSPPLLPFS
jgi:hypothetical protein